jgi:hypothetical protein
MGEDWRENSNGNWLLIEDGKLEATVYAAGSEWGSVWNASDGRARRLKAKHQTAEEAMTATEAAIAAGPSSIFWWPPDDQWQTTKKGDGFYRKHSGQLISVKQAKTGSWFATNGTASLGRYGRTTWFPTAAEARAAVDALARGEGEWHWVSRSDAA